MIRIAYRGSRGFLSMEQHLVGTASLPFEFCIVDEAQDISVAELRFLAVLGAGRPNSLFFAGDLGQRIFQAPFSWYTLGIDVRGRSKTLRINYRTSHQIRLQADRLLPRELADMDGIIEQRGNTVSVFNGPEPCIKVLDRSDEEAAIIAEWLRARCQDAHEPHEIAVFVRSKAEIPRALEAIDLADLSAANFGPTSDAPKGRLSSRNNASCKKALNLGQ